MKLKRGSALTHENVKEGMKVVLVDFTNQDGELMTIVNKFSAFIRAARTDGRVLRIDYSRKYVEWRHSYVVIELYEYEGD